MASEKMEFRAKYDGVCIKCGQPIKGWLSHGGVERKNDADLITWARTPRADGLKGINWHIACNELPDRADLIAAKLARQGKEAPKTEDNDIPMEAPKATPKANPVHTVPAANNGSNGGDFLAGMAQALAPYLDGKITVKAAELSAELEAKIAAAVANASKVITVKNERNGEVKNVGRAHEKFEKLLKLIAGGFNVYMWGEPGSGKSTAAINAAEALGLSHGYISLTAQTAESRLMGFIDANGIYRGTEFYRCYSEGGLFCIDEMDNASANLLTALNSALENGKAAFPCGNVNKHKDFILVATGNTVGYGANPMFPERRPMDAAFRERFVFLEWGYDESLERDIAIGVSDTERTRKWVTWVQAVRKFAKTNYPKLIVTPRASIKGAGLLGDFTASEVAEMVIFKGFDKDSVGRIVAANPLPRM